jgi:uncharacterized damage-inducible protein DinB
MTVDDCRSLFAYNAWANDRILGCIESLDAALYARRLVSSFPSLRDTFAHIVATEWVWLKRWRGESPAAPPAWMDTPTPAELRDQLQEIEAGRTAYLATLRDEDLKREIHFTYQSGDPGRHVLSDLILHLVNHSTYHRGQAVTLLRQAGARAPSTDLDVFKTPSVAFKNAPG